MLWRTLNREGLEFQEVRQKNSVARQHLNKGWKEVEEAPGICLVISISGQGKASVIAQRQEPGSIAGPAKSRGQGCWSGMSEGTVTEKEVREVARLGEMSSPGARLSGAH